MLFRYKKTCTLGGLILAALVTYAAYDKVAYYTFSVHEQHAKPGIWTDGNTGELLDHYVTYHVEFRKRALWLPGSEIILAGLTEDDYKRLRRSAVCMKAWDNNKTFGTAFYFVDRPTDWVGDPEGAVPIPYEKRIDLEKS